MQCGFPQLDEEIFTIIFLYTTHSLKSSGKLRREVDKAAMVEHRLSERKKKMSGSKEVDGGNALALQAPASVNVSPTEKEGKHSDLDRLIKIFAPKSIDGEEVRTLFHVSSLGG